jgi:acetoin utilization deacetylase AcuC-like enzyme
MDAVSRALKASSLGGSLSSIEPRAAEEDEILLVHTERLYQEVMATRGKDHTYLDSDTITSAESADVAVLAAGSVLGAVDAVIEGKISNAFAFVRPPGHHAKPDKAMGFCLFNNVAIAARYVIRAYDLRRVLIVDFDLHHGNGTQKAFYTSPEVLYISTHQWPHYPGTGSLEEVGRDAGEGFTLNIPLPAGTGDAEYSQIFREIVAPVSREFAPELVLVSAGFDAYHKDPLGSMRLTEAGYAALTREILSIAGAACGGKTVFALEGGYHLAGVEQSIVSVLEVMGGVSSQPEGFGSAAEQISPLLEGIRKLHGSKWSCLQT